MAGVVPQPPTGHDCDLSVIKGVGTLEGKPPGGGVGSRQELPVYPARCSGKS